LKKKVLAIVFLFWLILLFITPMVIASPFFYRTYERIGNGRAYSVVQTSDDGYALLGLIQIEDYSSSWLVKTDLDGNMEWNETFEDGLGNVIVQKGDGGYVLAGSTNSFGAGGSDFWLVKTDSVGNMVWNKTYGGVKSDYVHSVAETIDGGYVLAGAKEQTNMLLTTMWLIKTDHLGNMEWNQTYGYGSANSVIQTSNGDYVMAGTNLNDFCLVKVDEAGTIPEFPSWAPLLVTLIAVVAIVVVYRNSLSKSRGRVDR
jgi:hypothetical protein